MGKDRNKPTKKSQRQLPAVRREARALTAAEFRGLANVPPEAEWFANIDNPQTRRIYPIDIREFLAFVGIEQPEEFRVVMRSHVLAWRKDLERHELSSAAIRRKLSAVSSLFEHLCDANAVMHKSGERREAREGREL
jgi:integrase/recombinase XerD